MNAYFNTNHVASLLFLVTISAWGMMELSQRSQPRRQGATTTARVGVRLVALACLIAATVVINLTPRVFPAAAIRAGAVAFAAGMVVLLAGLVLRGWSFKALGQYFTHTVMVRPDQPVIASGPYRVLRHPSYTGMTLPADVPREQVAGAPAKMMEPERAAQVILDGVARNKAMIVFLASIRWGRRLDRLLPGLSDRILLRQMRESRRYRTAGEQVPG